MAERKTIDEREQEILSFWKENDIFAKSLKQTRDGESFVFYEGPPTANARPGLHHVLARSYKDIFPRYQTMRGRFVLRKGGWDTHGLPVEVEVEKALGLSGKQEIEEYGVAAFNKRCRESVWKYKEEWEQFTERMGFWIDLKDPYITYEPRYMETLWWVVKRIYERGLLEKDFLVVPYCPRCGTALSSHEVAQGYKTISDPAITVKFPLKDDPDNASLLVWTTTPWTLLANVAAAVNPSLSYMRVRHHNDVFILAKGLEHNLFGEDWEYVEGPKGEIQGNQLVGGEYEPPYRVSDEAAFPRKIVSADYVSADDGTGIVHIAPFGEEDMNIIRVEKLPTPIPVEEDGRVAKNVEKFGDLFVREANPAIIRDLDERGLLLRADAVEHEYPFCWRCDSPLLYYPRESWMVRMASLRDELKKRNEMITWVPEHTKEGRFGQWLEEVKDWNFSRERYWGTPLPVWQCEKCGQEKVIGSIAEFPIDDRNTFILLRHGEADHNVEGRTGSSQQEKDSPSLLTDKGKRDAQSVTESLRDKGITRIIASPFARTQETARIVADSLGLKVETDDRLQEINTGVVETSEEYSRHFLSCREYFETAPPNGESRMEAQARMVRFFKKFNEENEGEVAVVVTHGDPAWLLEGAFEGWSYERMLQEKRKHYIATGEARKLTVRMVPTDAEGRIDLHRPFVDEVFLPCSCGAVMRRVLDVIDVWFDSGAMPFAQWHYPFEHESVVDGDGDGDRKDPNDEAWPEKVLPRQYPANFIAEALEQTRGWFYTLLAVATLLEKEVPYKAVISHGLVLDEEGQKMSKTKGNAVDPWELFEQFGADAVRWTLVTINSAGEPKRFGGREVQDRQRRVFDTVRNVVQFYQLYRVEGDEELENVSSVLDQWMLSRTNKSTEIVRGLLDGFIVHSAGREIEDLIDDLSNWYVRRSRRRFQQPKDEQDHRVASATLRQTLHVLARLMAPIAPFIAEEIFQTVKHHNDVESVHLSAFPEFQHNDRDMLRGGILYEMDDARTAAAEGLRLRAEAGINVRQPLQSFSYPSDLSEELSGVVADEINVKEIKRGDLHLDTEMTKELKQEGVAREIERKGQLLRKKANLEVGAVISGITITSRVRLSVGDSLMEDIRKALKANDSNVVPDEEWEEHSKRFEFVENIKIDGDATGFIALNINE